ncbi:his operon leader peptide [Klebsiella sp. K794]|uniref:his operon leader peptide n=1 Tax=Klebsiella michiganensis TaxID=1134687 RepID=A0AAJ1NSI7_9ENTR|nr:his operon leader peptide [Klebsiella michiganensis]MDH0964350.1 his operon leader peptide [Klebsiella michiganensis]MDM4121861.1 his operon leader peptide [Klebsiella michiganensis]MDM4158723.1 his operon leader peptide [Klebsiella michiganensis]MDS7754196.1 his operon leader peptide [Klebsiella michiganensis]NHE80353.1 his operon leader peptide [Klebsiella michiganensis]
MNSVQFKNRHHHHHPD